MARRSSIQSGTTKSLIYSIVCMLAGIGLFIGGVAVYQDPADCGGQTMQQGDTCEVTDNGSTSDNSLASQEASNHREAIVMFVLGPLMLVGGGFWFSGEMRTRQRRNGAPARAGNLAAAGAPPFPGPAQAFRNQAPPQQQQQQQWGAPQQPQAWGAPQQQPQYGAPQQPQYAAPQQQQQQQQQYGAPQPQYGTPQPQPQQYGVPQQPQYGAPQQPQQYGVPPQQQPWGTQGQQPQQGQGGWPS